MSEMRLELQVSEMRLGLQMSEMRLELQVSEMRLGLQMSEMRLELQVSEMQWIRVYDACSGKYFSVLRLIKIIQWIHFTFSLWRRLLCSSDGISNGCSDLHANVNTQWYCCVILGNSVHIKHWFWDYVWRDQEKYTCAI